MVMDGGTSLKLKTSSLPHTSSSVKKKEDTSMKSGKKNSSSRKCPSDVLSLISSCEEKAFTVLNSSSLWRKARQR